MANYRQQSMRKTALRSTTAINLVYESALSHRALCCLLLSLTTDYRTMAAHHPHTPCHLRCIHLPHQGAYISQPDITLDMIRTVPYDQYETAMPLASMADCMAGLLDVVYGPGAWDDNGGNNTDRGFRTAPLLRFIGQEDGLLSLTHDGPRMYLNMEDYYFYNAGRRPNAPFRAAFAHLRSAPACSGRLHWGTRSKHAFYKKASSCHL